MSGTQCFIEIKEKLSTPYIHDMKMKLITEHIFFVLIAMTSDGTGTYITLAVEPRSLMSLLKVSMYTLVIYIPRYTLMSPFFME